MRRLKMNCKGFDSGLGPEKMTQCNYRVTISVSYEEDLLQRIALLTSAMFRILRETKLKQVEEANYRAGRLVLSVMGPPNNPAMVSGKVSINVEPVV
jgi:hypothetical protein